MTLGRVEVGGGFLLCAALFYYLDGEGIVLWALMSCALHELGHLAAIRLLGGRVVKLRLTCAGAELRLSAARPLPPGRMMAAALAGPAVNLALAVGTARLARLGFGERLYLFAGLNLGLACFNLLPVQWLDGGRALAAWLTLLWSERLGKQVVAACTAALVAALLAVGAILLWESEGRNFTLLIAGLWMAGMAGRAKRAEIF